MLPEFGLTDKVIAVTGAGRGIGRRIAIDAARAGARVVACSRTGADLDSLASEIGDTGGTCATIEADVSRREGIAAFIDFAVESGGRLDGLVNNAGSNRLRDALDYSADEVDDLISLNLTAVYWACVLGARNMIDGGAGGSIVNITSQAGVVGAPGRAPYSAAKAGVNNLSRTLAAEWARHGVRVNALAPTVTLTPLGREALAQRPELAQEVRERSLFGRAAEVEEISLPTIFLLGPAASMITGHVLVVDGGWTVV